MLSPTEELIQSITYDILPGCATRLAFGIDTPQHFAAISTTYRRGEIDRVVLEGVEGKPSKLGELLRNCRSNPYPSLIFSDHPAE